MQNVSLQIPIFAERNIQPFKKTDYEKNNYAIYSPRCALFLVRG